METNELIMGWFEHIVQIARDRKTANGVVMSRQHALDEIASLAQDAAYFVNKYMKKSEI